MSKMISNTMINKREVKIYNIKKDKMHLMKCYEACFKDGQNNFSSLLIGVREGIIRKKKSCEFSQLQSCPPPPLKVVKTQIFFLTP